MPGSLSKEKIEYFLKNEFNIMVEDSVSSTNTVLKELAKSGSSDKTVLIANSQTSGKGRLGRSFYSPKNSGIYMSILLRPQKKFNYQYITPLTSVAVLKALEALGAKNLGIKWVNDIFLKNKKVAGILTEIGFKENSSEADFLIIGIGINLMPQKFPEELSEIAGSVFDKNIIDKNKIIAEILDDFLYFYELLPDLHFLKEYKSRSILKDRKVSVITPVSEKEAVVIGIDDECRLIAEFPDGKISHISTGEVSIKF